MLTRRIVMNWDTQVKAVLKNWYASEKLEQNPLAQLTLVSRQAQQAAYNDDIFRRAKALREVIIGLIEAFGVEGKSPPSYDQSDDLKWMDPHWRTYSILFLLSKGLTAGKVAERIGLALGGQYFRERADAITLLADTLRRREGSPLEGASQVILVYPSGAVKLEDPFYMEREADKRLTNGLTGSGETITIRGSRQTGKTSLLIRGMHRARRLHSARIVYFDLQSVGEQPLNSLDDFLRALADWIGDELDLDPTVVSTSWDSRLPAPRKLTKLIERHVLTADNQLVLLALDEIDQLQLTDFHSDFFGLVRSWHNRRAHDERWDRLSVIMAISTEPYLLIDNLHQSPFNVGLVLYLEDFDDEQVRELSNRYGLSLTTSEHGDVMQLLHGHPYLTRIAFYTMAVEALTWREFEQITCLDHGPYHQHLRHQYQLVADAPILKQTLQEILRSNRASDQLAALRLERAGLVRSRNGVYVLRCELYQHYFAERLL